MRRLILLSCLTFNACGPLGRLIQDPDRVCPSGMRLVFDDQGRPTCVPRETPRPTPEATSTPSPAPSATPTLAPATATPTPTPTSVNTPTPGPTATPTPVPPPEIKNEPCETTRENGWLASTHWDWKPPNVAIPARKNGPCPRFTITTGPDRNGVEACSLTYTKASGELGRTPAEGTDMPLRGGDLAIAPPGHPNAGMVCNMDSPGGDVQCGDAYTRPVIDGKLALDPNAELAWWDGTFAHIIPCPAKPTPRPTAGPTPTPSTLGAACDVVEHVDHWMAPGNKAHGWHPEGDLIRGVIDSTVRPICDTDHLDNLNDPKQCGGRSADPDYRKKQQAMDWKFSSNVQDLGPNTDDDDNTCSTREGTFPLGAPECAASWENSAQRVILAERGACVSVTVCIPEGARTPDGCLIKAKNGNGCDSRRFRFPEGGSCE